MSTRSFICKEQADGSYVGIYCHYDGYLTHNGAMLLDYYADEKKLDELLALGNISSLRPNVNPNPALPHDFENSQDDVTIAYHRDRGEEIRKAAPITPEAALESWGEYMYVFGRDGKWRYYDLYVDKTELRDVESDLYIEYEKMGIQRPVNFYGWLNNAEIQQIKAEQSQTGNSEAVM